MPPRSVIIGATFNAAKQMPRFTAQRPADVPQSQTPNPVRFVSADSNANTLRPDSHNPIPPAHARSKFCCVLAVSRTQHARLTQHPSRVPHSQPGHTARVRPVMQPSTRAHRHVPRTAVSYLLQRTICVELDTTRPTTNAGGDAHRNGARILD